MRSLKRPWQQERKPQAEKMEDRVRSDDKYHTWRWTKESKAFRVQHPLCAECEKQGKITASEMVDHIIPAEICADFFDKSNWQALCNRCNINKGARDKKIIQRHKRLTDS